MPLTTIDGQLCIPSSEFGHLTTFLGLKETALTDGRRLASLREAEDEFGAKERSYTGTNRASGFDAFSYMPDEWVIREIYKAIQPACDSAKCQLGEESIDGEVWEIPEDAQYVASDLSYYTDSDGKEHHVDHADLSLVGPASLGGKVVLELCRRLAQFCYMDDAAARYHSNPSFGSFPAATLEENIEKESFYHGQDHEPQHADV